MGGGAGGGGVVGGTRRAHAGVGLAGVLWLLPVLWSSGGAYGRVLHDDVDVAQPPPPSNFRGGLFRRGKEGAPSAEYPPGKGGFLSSLDEDEVRGVGRFNDTLSHKQAKLETVARMDKHKHKSREAQQGSNRTGILNRIRRRSAPPPPPRVIGPDGVEEEGEDESGEVDVARLIDADDNEYVISKPHKGVEQMELQEDFALIFDLVQVIVAAALGGLIVGLLDQPVMLGYLLAGSVVGPGGLGLIDELVQVETLAQFGVVFLLFALGVEFSAARLQPVRMVAVGGGFLQIAIAVAAGGTIAYMVGVSTHQGLFVGAFVSMSSTAVVLKCLMDSNQVNTQHGQVMLGTLITQDCALGILLATLPALASGHKSPGELMARLLKELAILSCFLTGAFLVARFMVPPYLRLLQKLSRSSKELYQLGVVSVCLCVALLSQQLGLSVEVGAFIAGLMLSGSEYSEMTMQQVEPVRNIFAALFLASIGMIMHPSFLWHHFEVLILALALLFFGKTLLIGAVVRIFGYPPWTALSVGISLAQIGEFSFVLLSRAKALQLVHKRLYLLLLGTTALSLLVTPFAFKLIAQIMRRRNPAGVGVKGVKVQSPQPSTTGPMDARSPAAVGGAWVGHGDVTLRAAGGAGRGGVGAGGAGGGAGDELPEVSGVLLTTGRETTSPRGGGHLRSR